jgi:hypothetical protein
MMTDPVAVHLAMFLTYMIVGAVLGITAHRLRAVKTIILFALAVSAMVIVNGSWPYGVRGLRGLMAWFLEGLFWVGGAAVVHLSIPFALGFLASFLARRMQARHSAQPSDR